MTRQVTVELPEEAMQVLRLRPDQLPQELREAAMLRCLSQGQAAALLGLSHRGVLRLTQCPPGFSGADDR